MKFSERMDKRLGKSKDERIRQRRERQVGVLASDLISREANEFSCVEFGKMSKIRMFQLLKLDQTQIYVVRQYTYILR